MLTNQHTLSSVSFSSAVFLLLFNACVSQTTRQESIAIAGSSEGKIIIDSSGLTLSERISVPEDFERIKLDSGSFGLYLRNIPLKSHGTLVSYFDGRKKTKPNVYCAVIDQEIDKVDLQQCADAVMRLRGEYLFSVKRYSAIHFEFLSDRKPHYYSEYVKGDHSYKKFRAYMRYIFSYANTASLKDELEPVSISVIQPGDVFIQSGNPYGHAVIVMDVATDGHGKKLFLLAQSYMPAQETQILINPMDDQLSPWYEIGSTEIRTPEWTFKATDLRRFRDE